VWNSNAAEPQFGILPFILTSIYGTAGAILLGVPVGYMTAVFLAKMAPPKLKTAVSAAVSLLAGVPSVVYGLVGMLVLVPGIRQVFHIPDGSGLLAAISRTFSELRGVPSVVGRSADGFEVDGKPAADLSGSTLDILGLAVRISLMRAFLPGAGLLILDEPAAAMDAAREERLLAALATLDFGQVLMVSHGDTAKAVAGNVVLL
jgi:hypothetical protein